MDIDFRKRGQMYPASSVGKAPKAGSIRRNSVSTCLVQVIPVTFSGYPPSLASAHGKVGE